MTKEILLTNKVGGFCSTTVVGCNIRKYNGLLVVPVEGLDAERHVLLSSLDETVVQHGAEFNLGVHKYQGENYSPKGHKYIVQFEWGKTPSVIFRVGGVHLKKEWLLVGSEHRLFLRYTLLEAHSPTLLRLRPFLAFRSVREFTHRNMAYDGHYDEVANGIRMCMYYGYPDLFLQLNRRNDFHYQPDWYMGLDYPRERERGYSSDEDLFCPGYFELPIKKGESVMLSAGTSPMNPNMMKRTWEAEWGSQEEMSNFYNCLVRSAHQFYQNKNGEHYIIAGHPWFGCRARDMLLALPGLTLALGETERFENCMGTVLKALSQWMNGEKMTVDVCEVEQPDVMLWAVWCLQQYAAEISYEDCYRKFGGSIRQILDFIMSGKHPYLFVHDNGLLYVNGKERAMTWMNSSQDGRPVVARSGYVVEFNAVWYDILNFWSEILDRQGEKASAEWFHDKAFKVGASFRSVFINKFGYLFDYVDGTVQSWDVRPNMLFSVALEYSPLTREERKTVLDVCTRELLTSKGIRSLTPKSGAYNPIYQGSQRERDRAYHQGTAWPWLTGIYLQAYLKVYKKSGLSFIENQLIGFEEEMFYHSLGSIPELFDGNPPFHGRGAIAFAMNVAGIIRAIRLLDRHRED